MSSTAVIERPCVTKDTGISLSIDQHSHALTLFVSPLQTDLENARNKHPLLQVLEKVLDYTEDESLRLVVKLSPDVNVVDISGAIKKHQAREFILVCSTSAQAEDVKQLRLTYLLNKQVRGNLSARQDHLLKLARIISYLPSSHDVQLRLDHATLTDVRNPCKTKENKPASVDRASSYTIENALECDTKRTRICIKAVDLSECDKPLITKMGESMKNFVVAIPPGRTLLIDATSLTSMPPALFTELQLTWVAARSCDRRMKVILPPDLEFPAMKGKTPLFDMQRGV